MDPEQKRQVNFKNCLAMVSRHLEDIMFVPARCTKKVMDDIIGSIFTLSSKGKTWPFLCKKIKEACE